MIKPVQFKPIKWENSMIDTFRTFYFTEFTDLKNEFEIIKTNFVFI